MLALLNFWKNFIHKFTWRVTGPNFLNFCHKLGQYVRQIRSVGKCLCVKVSLFVCSVSFTCQASKAMKKGYVLCMHFSTQAFQLDQEGPRVKAKT